MRVNSFKRLLALGLVLVGTFAQAQVKGPIERYAATTANVAAPGEPITIELTQVVYRRRPGPPCVGACLVR